ncbi:hypothetical protein ADUPG1_009688 [Aduncisulcus paluster]|uniref:Uncharacterized protein n=1 Tax=Aduncisulcus paluster TaxID=2918883 RepID=A0ABQ5KWI0_9EUKA|nr:hypothetical protein ADUPG1_009688 [Aduncisulcus paluster]
MDIRYTYSRPRRSFGRILQFQYTEPVLIADIPPKEEDESLVFKCEARSQAIQACNEKSVHEVNTEIIPRYSRGIRHKEGGWPKEIDPDHSEFTIRFCKKTEHEKGFLSALRKTSALISCLCTQNIAIDITEQYFTGKSGGKMREGESDNLLGSSSNIRSDEVDLGMSTARSQSESSARHSPVATPRVIHDRGDFVRQQESVSGSQSLGTEDNAALISGVGGLVVGGHYVVPLPKAEVIMTLANQSELTLKAQRDKQQEMIKEAIKLRDQFKIEEEKLTLEAQRIEDAKKSDSHIKTRTNVEMPKLPSSTHTISTDGDMSSFSSSDKCMYVPTVTLPPPPFSSHISSVRVKEIANTMKIAVTHGTHTSTYNQRHTYSSHPSAFIWDVCDNTFPEVGLSAPSPISTLSFTQSPALLCGGLCSGTICVFDTRAGYKSQAESLAGKGHSMCVTAVDWVSSATTISASLDGTVSLWDVRKLSDPVRSTHLTELSGVGGIGGWNGGVKWKMGKRMNHLLPQRSSTDSHHKSMIGTGSIPFNPHLSSGTGTTAGQSLFPTTDSDISGIGGGSMCFGRGGWYECVYGYQDVSLSGIGNNIGRIGQSSGQSKTPSMGTPIRRLVSASSPSVSAPKGPSDIRRGQSFPIHGVGPFYREKHPITCMSIVRGKDTSSISRSSASDSLDSAPSGPKGVGRSSGWIGDDHGGWQDTSYEEAAGSSSDIGTSSSISFLVGTSDGMIATLTPSLTPTFTQYVSQGAINDVSVHPFIPTVYAVTSDWRVNLIRQRSPEYLDRRDVEDLQSSVPQGVFSSAIYPPHPFSINPPPLSVLPAHMMSTPPTQAIFSPIHPSVMFSSSAAGDLSVFSFSMCPRMSPVSSTTISTSPLTAMAVCELSEVVVAGCASGKVIVTGVSGCGGVGSTSVRDNPMFRDGSSQDGQWMSGRRLPTGKENAYIESELEIMHKILESAEKRESNLSHVVNTTTFLHSLLPQSAFRQRDPVVSGTDVKYLQKKLDELFIV